MDDKDRSRDSGRDRDRSRRGDRPSRFSEGNVRDRSNDRSHDRGGRKSSNCRVYVSNISYEYRWQDLKDLFRDNVGDVSFVELFVDENDKPKGCGIVEFSDPSLVKKCMEVMHRFDLKGRKLVIKEDFGNERDKYGNIINGRRNRDRDRNMDKGDWEDRDHRRGGNWDNNPPSLLSNMMSRNTGPSEPVEFKWGNTYGLSPQFLESLNIHKPLVNRVFVANLDYKVDEKKLREVFKLCGKVIDVELYHDKEGNSRGFAVVEFDHPVESVQAISMLHNQLLYDRPMTVRMDRIDHDTPVKLPEGLKAVGMGLGLNGDPLRDVSRNVANSGNTGGAGGSGSNSGPGILGAVPNPASLQALTGNLGNTCTAAALSNVVNNSTLAGLSGTSAAALQASLAGVQAPFLNSSLANSLGGGLGNSLGNNLGDGLNLSGLTNSNLNSSLSNLNNTLAQNHALAALGSAGGGNSGGSLNSSMMTANRLMSGGERDFRNNDNSGNSSFMMNSGDNQGRSNQGVGGGGNNMGGNSGGNISNSLMAANRLMSGGERDFRNSDNSGNSSFLMNSGDNQGRSSQGVGSGNREYSSSRDYETSSSIRNNYDIKTEVQDSYRHNQQSSIYSTVNNGSQSRPSNNDLNTSRGNGFSDTIVISNLPISATWKMLKEKFSNSGDVQYVEMKTKDTAIIRFASQWQAERAIKLMDRTRIDGRTLDVRFFY